MNILKPDLIVYIYLLRWLNQHKIKPLKKRRQKKTKLQYLYFIFNQQKKYSHYLSISLILIYEDSNFSSSIHLLLLE
jgi:hypothetical protein